ncbi:uncharacterized protein ACB058_005143 [Synchiropus picturatus]
MSSKVVHNLFEFKERDLVAKMKGQRDALKCVHDKVACITRLMETERNPREQESRRALQAAMMDQEQLQQEVHKLLSGNVEVQKTLVERDQLQLEIQKQREKTYKELTERVLLEKVLEENQKILVREKNLKEEYIKREKEIRADIEMLRNYRHNEILKEELQLEIQKLTELLEQERDNYLKENTHRLQLERDFEKIQEELRGQKNLNQEFILKENETRTELENLRKNSGTQAQKMALRVRETNVEDQKLLLKEMEVLVPAYLDRDKFLMEQKALRENYACLKEELETMTASYHEVTCKCEEMEKRAQALEQRLKMEVKMNEENVKNDLALIKTIRADQESFWRKMEEEMEAVHVEAAMREESLREEVEELKAQLQEKEEMQEPPITHFEVNFHVEFLPRTPEILEEDLECKPQLVKVQMTKKNNYPSLKSEEKNISPDPDDPLAHLPVATLTSNDMQMREELQRVNQNLRMDHEGMSDELLTGPKESIRGEANQPKSEEQESEEELAVQQVPSSWDVVEEHIVGQQKQPRELQENVEEATCGQDNLRLREDSEEKMAQQLSLDSEELDFVILEDNIADQEVLEESSTVQLQEPEIYAGQQAEDVLRLDIVEVQGENPVSGKVSEETVAAQGDNSLREELELNHQPEESEEVKQESSGGDVSTHHFLLLGIEADEDSKHIPEKTVSCPDNQSNLDLNKQQKHAVTEFQQEILEEQVTSQKNVPVSVPKEPEVQAHEQEQQEPELETGEGVWTDQKDLQLSNEAPVVKAYEEHLILQNLVSKEELPSHENILLRLDIEEPGVQKDTQTSELSGESATHPEDASLRHEPVEHSVNNISPITSHCEQQNQQQDQKTEELKHKIPEEILSDLDDLLLRENVDDLKDQDEQEELLYKSLDEKEHNQTVLSLEEEKLVVYLQMQDIGAPQTINSERAEAGQGDVREEVEHQLVEPQKYHTNDLCNKPSDKVVIDEEIIVKEAKDQMSLPLDGHPEKVQISEEMLPEQADMKDPPHSDIPEEHQQSLVQMFGDREQPNLKVQPGSEELLEAMLPDEDSVVCSDDLSIQSIQTGSADSNPQPQKPQTFLKKAHQYLKLKTPGKNSKLKNISTEYASSPSASPQRSLSESKKLFRGEVFPEKFPGDMNRELSSAQADKTEAAEEDLSNDETSVHEAEELMGELWDTEPQREMPTSKKVWKKTCQFLNLKTLKGKKKRSADRSPTRSCALTNNSSSTENITREKENRRNLDAEQEPAECQLDNVTAEEAAQEPEGDQFKHTEEACCLSDPHAQMFLEKDLQQLEMTQQKSCPLPASMSLDNQKTYKIEVKINKEDVQPDLRLRRELEEEGQDGWSGGVEGERVIDPVQEDSEELQNLSIQLNFPDPHDQELLDEFAKNRQKVLNLQMVCKGPLNILHTKAFISLCQSPCAPSLAPSPDM